MPILIAIGLLYVLATLLQSPEGRKTLGIMALIFVGVAVILSAGAGTWAHG